MMPPQTPQKQLEADVKEACQRIEADHAEWLRTGELPKPSQEDYNRSERIYQNLKRVYPED